jgi:hypothetical protein
LSEVPEGELRGEKLKSDSRVFELVAQTLIGVGKNSPPFTSSLHGKSPKQTPKLQMRKSCRKRAIFDLFRAYSFWIFMALTMVLKADFRCF